MLAKIKDILRPAKRMAERAVHGEPISRKSVARQYLKGHGLEIGALHLPLAVPPAAEVRYVDRMSVNDLRSHYPELANLPLVPLDVIDDGERLSTVPEASEDFVIANHFLEHCQDPLGTIQNMMRVLKPGGILFLAVPDKRGTFDRMRPVTPLQHIVDDHEQGPARSRAEHFGEWVKYIQQREGDDAEAETRRLMDQDYSIHFHVWDVPSYVAFLVEAQRRMNFEIEMCASCSNEIVAVLRKAGGNADKGRERTALESLAACRKRD